MSEYYGVTRSGSSLKHYGVRGMKWGVRKAIERGDRKMLDRNFRRAERKLKRLNKRADIRVQERSAKRNARISNAALGIGGIAGGVHVGNRLLARYLAKTPGDDGALVRAITQKKNKAIVGTSTGVAKKGQGLGIGPVGNANTHVSNSIKQAPAKSNPFQTVHNVTLGLGAAGLAAGLYAGAKAKAARKRTTKEGHAKAVAKRDKWYKEMNKAFANTVYDSSYTPKRRRRK